MANIGPMQLLIIFPIVLLIFGTKKLRNVGGDLGSAIRDFRKGMSNDEESGEQKPDQPAKDPAAEQAPSSEPSQEDAGKPKS